MGNQPIEKEGKENIGSNIDTSNLTPGERADIFFPAGAKEGLKQKERNKPEKQGSDKNKPGRY